MADKKRHVVSAKPLTAKELDHALGAIYYGPGGYQGVTALHARLQRRAASKKRVRTWIAKQEVGRYMQTKPPREVFSHFTDDRPNFIHQADLLYLPHDRAGRKTYKYALTFFFNSFF